jgi:hypothetical protein
MRRAWKVARFTFMVGCGLGRIVVGVAVDEWRWRRSRSALDDEPGMAAWFATVLGEIADFGEHGSSEFAGQERERSRR